MNKSKYRFCVYRIKNKINGNFYIGSSSNVKKRWETHRRNISAYQPGKNINNSFDLPFLMKMDIEGGEIYSGRLWFQDPAIFWNQKRNAPMRAKTLGSLLEYKTLLQQRLWSHWFISSRLLGGLEYGVTFIFHLQNSKSGRKRFASTQRHSPKYFRGQNKPLEWMGCGGLL